MIYVFLLDKPILNPYNGDRLIQAEKGISTRKERAKPMTIEMSKREAHALLDFLWKNASAVPITQTANEAWDKLAKQSGYEISSGGTVKLSNNKTKIVKLHNP